MIERNSNENYIIITPNISDNCDFLANNSICCFITALIIESKMTGRIQLTEMTVIVTLFRISSFFRLLSLETHNNPTIQHCMTANAATELRWNFSLEKSKQSGE